MALVIAYLLVGGLVRGMSYAEGASSTPSVGGSLSVTLASFGCAAVVVAIFIAMRNDELALNLLWAVVSLLYFMGLFGMVSASGFLGSGLFVAARTCFTLLLFLSLADLAASKGHQVATCCSSLLLKRFRRPLLTYLSLGWRCFFHPVSSCTRVDTTHGCACSYRSDVNCSYL